jgi:anthranilate synthase component 2
MLAWPIPGLALEAAAMILVIDNYDSFTYNLVHYVSELGGEPVVRRNDAITVEEALALKPDGILLSPGPCTPNEAGICLELIGKAPQDMPILGVCLGHQAIGQAFGGKVIRAKALMHGKTSAIHHTGQGVFEGLPDGYTATRYHSLSVEKDSLPAELEVTAWTDDGEIMGFQHRNRPIFGVQFHPESFATEYGHELIGNFLRRAQPAEPAEADDATSGAFKES